MPLKKKSASKTKSTRSRSSAAKRTTKPVAKKMQMPRRKARSSGKPRGGSPAKIHQGVGLQGGASQSGGLTRAAEKIGAAIGKMDTAIHTAAALGSREVAAVAERVHLLTDSLSNRSPQNLRNRSVRRRKQG